MNIKVYLMLSTVFLFACSKTSEVKQAIATTETSTVYLTSDQLKSAQITYTELSQQKLSEVIKVNGMFHVPPQYNFELSAFYAGYVKSIPVIEGMKVAKGQTLLTLENPEYLALQRDYITQWNKLKFLDNDYKRQALLARDSITSQRNYQQSESEYLIAKANVQALEQQLKMIGFNTQDILKGKLSAQVYIKSPINGYITRLMVTNGQFVSANTLLLNVVNLDHIHAELSVYEKDIVKLKANQKIKIMPSDAIGVDTMQGSIYLVGKEVRADKTVMVHAHLEGNTSKVFPGMYLHAYIETSQNKTWSLPETAIVSYAEQSYVFVRNQSLDKKNGDGEPLVAFDRIAVKTGIKALAITEVAYDEALKGKQIVNQGAYTLLSSMINKEEE